MELAITSAAEKFIRRMIRFNGGSASHGFRLVVSPGGCSGLTSEFSVEAKPLDGDVTIDSNGLTLFMPLPSSQILEGGTIDFRETSLTAGLVFTTPNDTGASSCSDGQHSHGNNAPVEISIESIRRRV